MYLCVSLCFTQLGPRLVHPHMACLFAKDENAFFVSDIHSYLQTLSLILAPNLSGSRPGVTGSGRPSPRKKSKNLVWSQFRKACDRCTDKKVSLTRRCGLCSLQLCCVCCHG